MGGGRRWECIVATLSIVPSVCPISVLLFLSRELVRFQKNFMITFSIIGGWAYHLLWSDNFSHSYGPLMNTTPTYSIYFVSTLIISNY